MAEDENVESRDGGNGDNGDDALTIKLHKHQVHAGRAGGRSRSDAKRAAVRANLAKARLNRWPGREPAARAAYVPIPEGETEASEEGGMNGHPRSEERQVLQGIAGAIQEQGPPGPGPLPDQPNSGNGQPTNGRPRFEWYTRERDS